MCQTILGSPSFFFLLLQIDLDIANQTQAAGCQACGSTLHCGHYARKPKGIDKSNLYWHEYQRRLSFCCSNTECRKRHTPASVRFFERRHYLSFVFTLASSLAQGLNVSIEERLCANGIPRQTLHRWVRWWRESFVAKPVWQGLKAYFLNVRVIPQEALESYPFDCISDCLVAWLRHLCSV